MLKELKQTWLRCILWSLNGVKYLNLYILLAYLEISALELKIQKGTNMIKNQTLPVKSSKLKPKN